MHRTDKYSQYISIIWPVWLECVFVWLSFVYELSGFGLESTCEFLVYHFYAKKNVASFSICMSLPLTYELKN